MYPSCDHFRKSGFDSDQPATIGNPETQRCPRAGRAGAVEPRSSSSRQTVSPSHAGEVPISFGYNQFLPQRRLALQYMAKGEFEEEEVEEMRGTLVHEGWQVLDRKYICKDLISLGSLVFQIHKFHRLARLFQKAG